MFSGSWFYDYPLCIKDKSKVNAISFGNDLLKALNFVGLDNVDLIIESYGGLIGACVSNSIKINKVLEIHLPILGTPFADKELINSVWESFSFKEKFLK